MCPRPSPARRRPNGAWSVSQLNTKFGRAEYCIVKTWNEVGEAAMIAWAESECTPAEVEALGRMLDSDWDPEALIDGDAALLEGVIGRLPRKP